VVAYLIGVKPFSSPRAMQVYEEKSRLLFKGLFVQRVVGFGRMPLM